MKYVDPFDYKRQLHIFSLSYRNNRLGVCPKQPYKKEAISYY